MTWLYAGLLAINLLGFVLAGVDKRRAVRKLWRIPERQLLLVAFLGGSVGLYLGFRVFRHKTRHPKFMIGVPLVLLLQVGLVVLWMLYGTQLLAMLQAVPA
jgi:uncharacterized membrane protein YsdA (DUF1294 family)